jgi:hypothetical protein
VSAWFTLDPLLAISIGAAMCGAIVLLLLFARRYRWALIALQPVAAALLLAALSLHDGTRPTALVVIAGNGDIPAVSGDFEGVPVVALPAATTTSDVERVPDLATALRRYRDAEHVHIVGAGLEAHDRLALAGREVSFAPPIAESAAPRIVEIETPQSVQPGAWWQVSGRALDAVGMTVELLDPAGQSLAEVVLDERGSFSLRGLSRAAGPALFTLRLRDGEREIQSVALPVDARERPPVRVLVLAAAPSPELKYLRRWALDAGVDFESRVALAPTLLQRRGNATIDAATLAELDLLIVDERSWAQLSSQKLAIRSAIADGLGLLVRVTGPVPARVAQDWNELGLAAVFGTERPRNVEWRVTGATEPIELHAWPVTSENAALLRDGEGRGLATFAALGRGRVGLWWLTDTHRLYTRGDRASYATLWADAWSTLARARGEPELRVSERLIVGNRGSICGFSTTTKVEAPSGSSIELVVDPAARDCAAFWPRDAGWHRVRSESAASVDGGTDAQESGVRSVYVYSRDEVGSLLRYENRRATEALVSRDEAPQGGALDRNFWRVGLLFGWLVVMVGIWGVERGRVVGGRIGFGDAGCA